MINITRDKFALSRKSLPADPNNGEDRKIAAELVDTMNRFKAYCTGMAANMINHNKRIIGIFDVTGGDEKLIVMYNPKIIRHSSQVYRIAEGCLSMDPNKSTEVWRYTEVTVEYTDENGKKLVKTFNSLTAQAIQHYIDHLDGKVI